jgi:hypothetical protein
MRTAAQAEGARFHVLAADGLPRRWLVGRGFDRAGQVALKRSWDKFVVALRRAVDMFDGPIW